MELLNTFWLGMPVWIWLAFLGTVLAVLAFDLGIMHREARDIGVSESLRMSALYVGLGLAWAGAPAATITTAARALAATQREDGGWSQLATMGSDAYASGQALFALNTAARMAVSDPVFRKGIDYLLRTQHADGSWQVATRSIWVQPYFESGFPHGHNQWISTAGTAWAVMALSLTQPQAVTRLNE